MNDVRWAGTLEKTRQATERSEAALERLCREGIPPSLIVVINLVFGLFVMAIGAELVVHGIANHGAIVRAH